VLKFCYECVFGTTFYVILRISIYRTGILYFMGNKRFTKYFIIFILLLSGMIVSCQKDQDNDVTVNSNLSADSSSMSALTTPGNYLAVKGSLKITIQDSTYTFDAAHDSIAFVNVHSGSSQYFGITAINKAHNMSFGISSAGNAQSNINTAVAGSQFLIRSSNKPDISFALSQFAASQDFGKISLSTYKQDSVLAKGTFYTFLAKDAKVTSPFYKVKGTFSLQLK